MCKSIEIINLINFLKENRIHVNWNRVNESSINLLINKWDNNLTAKSSLNRIVHDTICVRFCYDCIFQTEKGCSFISGNIPSLYDIKLAIFKYGVKNFTNSLLKVKNELNKH